MPPDRLSNLPPAQIARAGSITVERLEEVLDLLACPACLQPLSLSAGTLACGGCKRVYPVEDGIPILLIDRATRPA